MERMRPSRSQVWSPLGTFHSTPDPTPVPVPVRTASGNVEPGWWVERSFGLPSEPTESPSWTHAVTTPTPGLVRGDSRVRDSSWCRSPPSDRSFLYVSLLPGSKGYGVKGVSGLPSDRHTGNTCVPYGLYYTLVP